MEQGSDLNYFKTLISELQESHKRSEERMKQLLNDNTDLEKEIKNLKEFKYELEARVKSIESEDFEKIKHELYKIESKLDKFESIHTDRKEKLNTIFNFAVQLAWVSMAAWLLTKLGLQPPL